MLLRPRLLNANDRVKSFKDDRKNQKAVLKEERRKSAVSLLLHSSPHNLDSDQLYTISLSLEVLETMVFSSNTCCFVLFLFLSLSANAVALRGAHRELEPIVQFGLEEKAVAIVDLKNARNYAILAKTGTTTVPASVITGGIAVYPGSSDLTQAVLDMEDAYNDAASRVQAPPDAARINLAAGVLNGVTLTPGVYTFTRGVTLTGDITFSGSATDVFIIQTTGNLVQAPHKSVILSGGVLASNIFWQVAGTVSVMAGAHMEGVLLGKTSVTFINGSTLNGRVMAQTACILQVATITEPV
jgi:hypothetical protein